VRIKADLKTIDKRRLIRDLRGKADVYHHSPNTAHYDRVIDCTGVARALLPPVKDDIILPCVQYRIRTDAPIANLIRLTAVGYAWAFPLGKNQYHVGCGSPFADPEEVLGATGWIDKRLSRITIICNCQSTVRLTSPHYALPFVAPREGTEVWGAGEAIGCVAPLAGDGIVPGMRSVQLLLEHWDNPVGYQKAVLREFRWMKEERMVVDNLRHSRTLGLKDAWVLKKNSKRMAMEVGIKEATKLLRNLRRNLQPSDKKLLANPS
jgi:flavin-dependent dehydrogenase